MELAALIQGSDALCHVAAGSGARAEVLSIDILGLSDDSVVLRSRTGSAEADADLVRRAWDLETLGRSYQAFVRTHGDRHPATPDDELRDTLVPVNNRWSVAEVLEAARYYADTTGRRVSIEYALIRDVNDQPWRADMLGKKLKKALGGLVHVNLIPLNPTPGSEWDASPKDVEREFVRRVIAQGVSCTVRDTRGQEIAAACGQLAAEN